MSSLFGKCASAAITSGLLAFGTAEASVVFSDDFESGNLSKWTFAVDVAEVSGAKVHAGSKALHIPYEVPAGEPAHRDNNRFVQVDLSSRGLNQFYVSGCFYLASTPASVTARKLYYIWGNPRQDPQWDLMLSANGGDNGVPLSLSISSNVYPYSDLRYPVWNIASGKIRYDRWHCISLEVQLNTPGQKNGSVRIEVDGVQEFARSNISIRNDSKPLGIVRIGAQIDRSAPSTERKYEDRYWDGIEIGTGAAPAPPKPPTDVRATQ